MAANVRKQDVPLPDVKANKVLRKVPRSALRAWTIGHLKTKQGGLCLLCKQPIDLAVKGNKSDYVCDHDHETGEIRGVLHRSCNAAEGKVANAAGRWGAKSMSYSALVPWLRNMLEYLEQPGTGLLYPDHKTPEEKELAAKQKAKRAAALRNARLKLRKDGK